MATISHFTFLIWLVFNVVIRIALGNSLLVELVTDKHFRENPKTAGFENAASMAKVRSTVIDTSMTEQEFGE